MKIYKSGNDSFNGTVTNYMESKLDTPNFTHPPTIKVTGSSILPVRSATEIARGAQINAYNAQKALARLCDVLANRGALTARDIMYICEDFYGDNITFTPPYEKEE